MAVDINQGPFRRHATYLAASPARFVLLLALFASSALPSCASRPVPMPTALPAGCADAQCGAGTCDDGAGKRDAFCTCAPGAFHARPNRCVEPMQTQPDSRRCTAPEHCDSGTVCERLSGYCVARDQTMCGTRPRNKNPRASEHQVLNGFCLYNHPGPGGRIAGCGEITWKDMCEPKLVCTATSPEGMSPICGYPQQRAGICRRACDLCADEPQCGHGEGCMLVAGRGVCLPNGEVSGECGEVVCAPGMSCRIGGMLRGPAMGTCVRHCDPKVANAQSSCPVGEQCLVHPRLPGIGTCTAESAEGPE